VARIRPEQSGTRPTGDILAAVERATARFADATRVLITTLPIAPRSSKRAGNRVVVLDRGALAAEMLSLHSTFEREQEQEASDQQNNADAAERVRNALLEGLTRPTEVLGTFQGVKRVPTLSPDPRDERVDAAKMLMPVQQALEAIATLVEEWERTMGPMAAANGALQLLAEPEVYAEMLARARHLVTALESSTLTMAAMNAAVDWPLAVWWEAVCEETRLRAEALGARCLAINPKRWPSFADAHDVVAAQRAVELQAASGRAALRARRLLDELDAPTPALRYARRRSTERA
jgi:hypothetical protein